MAAPTVPSDLSNALPRRAIAVRPPQTLEGGTFGVIALLLVMLGGLLAWLGPGIVNDWEMRHDAVAAPEVRIKQAGCRSWLVVFQFCTVTLAGEGDMSERTLRYAFIDNPGEQRMGLLRGRSGPSQVTTEFGLAKLYSRLTTLLLFVGIFVVCIGVAGSVLWKGLTAKRAFAGMTGQRLTPVVVEIERNNRLLPRRRLWVYLYDECGRRERALLEWPSRLRPLFTSADEKWALALKGEQGGPPMLLDADLKGLDLTDGERAAFREAFHATFGWPARGKAAV